MEAENVAFVHMEHDLRTKEKLVPSMLDTCGLDAQSFRAVSFPPRTFTEGALFILLADSNHSSKDTTGTALNQSSNGGKNIAIFVSLVHSKL